MTKHYPPSIKSHHLDDENEEEGTKAAIPSGWSVVEPPHPIIEKQGWWPEEWASRAEELTQDRWKKVTRIGRKDAWERIHDVPRTSLIRPTLIEKELSVLDEDESIGKFRLTIGEYSDGKFLYNLDCWRLTNDDIKLPPEVTFTGYTSFLDDPELGDNYWSDRKRRGNFKLPAREHETPVPQKCSSWRRTRNRIMLNRLPVNKAKKVKRPMLANPISDTAATGGDSRQACGPIEHRGPDCDNWEGEEEEMKNSFPELFADDDSYKDMAIKRVFQTDYNGLTQNSRQELFGWIESQRSPAKGS